MPRLLHNRIVQFGCLLISGLVLMGSCRKESFSPEQAESFIKFFGNFQMNEGSDVKSLYDGGFALIGNTITENLNQKIIFIRTDKYGNELWEPKLLGVSSYNTAYSLQVLSDGGFAIVGSTLVEEKDRTMVNNMLLIRTDINGNTLWTKNYGGYYDRIGYHLAETSDGGFIIIGSTEDLETGKLDILLIKTDSEGDVIWTQTHGGAGDDVGKSIAETANGYIYTGYTNSFSQPDQANYNIFIVKTNKLGRITHPITYGNTNDDFGKSLIPHPEGGYIILGTTINPSTNIKNIFLAHIKEDISKPVWIKQIGGQINHVASCFKITNDGGVAITGTQELSSLNHVIFLLKTDAEGNKNFIKTFGDSGFQQANAIDLTNDGGFIITGLNNMGGNSMITLIKTKADGNL